MTTFDDREHAFEAHFAFEAELEFRIQARRDRLLAVWAGGLLDLHGEALEQYVHDVMRADLRQPGDADVYQKVLSDLSARDVQVAPNEVHAKMDLYLAQARQELGADTGA